MPHAPSAASRPDPARLPRPIALAALLAAAAAASGCMGGDSGDGDGWLRFDPKQCGGNPWDTGGSQTVGPAEGDAIRAHYGHHGTTFDRLEMRVVREAVPAVCGAPRDYRWYAQVPPDDVAALVADGWQEGPGPDDDPDVVQAA